MEFKHRFPHFASDVYSALFKMDVGCLSSWYGDGRMEVKWNITHSWKSNQPLTKTNAFVSICIIQSKCEQNSKLMRKEL
jgi:hypothetical protein